MHATAFCNELHYDKLTVGCTTIASQAETDGTGNFETILILILFWALNRDRYWYWYSDLVYIETETDTDTDTLPYKNSSKTLQKMLKPLDRYWYWYRDSRNSWIETDTDTGCLSIGTFDTIPIVPSVSAKWYTVVADCGCRVALVRLFQSY